MATSLLLRFNAVFGMLSEPFVRLISIIVYVLRSSYNVKVVYDVFGVAIKELRSGSSNPKNVAEKKPTKQSPTGFFRSPIRFSGEVYTILLGDVWISYYFFIVDHYS
jgi:hypothetical protein